MFLYVPTLQFFKGCTVGPGMVYIEGSIWSMYIHVGIYKLIQDLLTAFGGGGGGGVVLM